MIIPKGFKFFYRTLPQMTVPGNRKLPRKGYAPIPSFCIAKALYCPPHDFAFPVILKYICCIEIN